MANIKSFPNNQNEYVGAEYVMRWLHGRSSGVFGADGNAAVAPVLDAMAVTVSDGDGWISNDNADGVVWWIDNESVSGSKLFLPVDMADAVLPRIDRVVVSWQTTNYVALPEVSILKGVPATYPVAPALTNNNVLRQISLAAIRIPAGSTAITSAMITDERLDSSVCGIVTDRVSVDTSMVNAQMKELLEQISKNLTEVISGTIPSGSVTREKLANDALYSPFKTISSAYTITRDDLGKKLLCNAGSSPLEVVFDDTSLAALPIGAEIVFIRWMSGSFTLKVNSNTTVVVSDVDGVIKQSGTDTVTITTDIYKTFGLQKVSSKGIYFTGVTEVV